MNEQPTRRTWLREPGPVLAFVVSAVVGLLYGFVDIHASSGGGLLLLCHLSACVLIGTWAAGRAWFCWLPLGMGLYLVHLAAIDHGWKPPFVEEDNLAARVTMDLLTPAGVGLMFGVAIRSGLSAIGVFRRSDGSRVRMLPSTVRGLIGTVVAFGLAFRLLSWVDYDASTIYSPGFDESSFHRIRMGARSSDVEARLGAPLSRSPLDEDGRELWIYGRGASSTSDYWRRWIIIQDGRVESTISDYWWD